MNNFVPNEDNVRFLGRAVFIDGLLRLAYSGSGAEFAFKGTSLSIVVRGDDNIEKEDSSNLPRIAVFVNGERVVDEVLSKPETTLEVCSSAELRECTVSVVKLSETGNSTCAIKSIAVSECGNIIPTNKKAHSIEFIGDSITCGYGVDTDRDHHFSTGTEDCTKTYAGITAQLLDCDCSIVAKSCHGVITASTVDGTKQNWGIMPQYYECFGSGAGCINGIYPESIKWDFNKHRNDVVVINLGTNDYTYTGDNPERLDEYRLGYVDFLIRLRELNPDSKIICTVGMMGDELYKTIECAADEYTSKTGDMNVVCYRFDVQDSADGYGGDYHPSAATHEKAAKKFAEFIKSVMGW